MPGVFLFTLFALASLIAAENLQEKDRFHGIICTASKSSYPVNVTIDFDAKTATVNAFDGTVVYNNIQSYWDGHASGLVNAGDSFSLFYRNNFGFYRNVKAFVLVRTQLPLLAFVEFGDCGHDNF